MARRQETFRSRVHEFSVKHCGSRAAFLLGAERSQSAQDKYPELAEELAGQVFLYMLQIHHVF